MIEIAMAGLLAAADLLIKARIEKEPQENFPRSLPDAKGRITIRKFHNDGFPFGVLREHSAVVKAVSLTMTLVAAGALAYLSGRREHRLERIGLTLVLGGALSNLYDRLVRNYVVDYITIEAAKLKKVVFNLGDFFVFIGSFLFVLAENGRDLRS